MKIAELREALESVTLEQKYLKARDARHRLSKYSSPCSLRNYNDNNAYPCNYIYALSSDNILGVPLSDL